jgi:polysaccharide pyruvyl transferase WcaK-like protein
MLFAARKVRAEMDRSLSIIASAVHERRELSPVNTESDGGAATNVILPASFGSMGDDALRAGTLAGAIALDRKVRLWVPGSVDNWPHEPLQPGVITSVDALRIGDTGFLNGPARRTFGDSDTVVVGADTMGGNYLHGFLAYRVSALREAARRGRHSKLVNFSMGSRPTRTALNLLRSLPQEVELWARDEGSRARTADFLNREVQLAPDIGALAKPTPSEEATRIMTRHESRPFVTLVPNAHFETLGWYTHEELVRFWAELAASLMPQFQIVILPHDVRPRPGDIAMSHEIAKRVTELTQSSVSVFVPKSAGEAKYLLRQSAGVISARMHACVGALSSGVPCVGIEYLNKFVGQFTWFGSLGEVVPLESSISSESVTSIFHDLLADNPRDTNWSNPITPTAIGWL